MKFKIFKNPNFKTKLCTLALATVMTTTLTSCSKKMECDEKKSHMHKYINTNGFTTYYKSEYETINDYTWTKEKVLIDSEDFERLYNLYNNENLHYIEDNIDVLKQIMSRNEPYKEYEYTYEEQEIDYYISPYKGISFLPFDTEIYYDIDGDLQTRTYYNVPVYKDVTRKAYSSNPNLGILTGMVRDVNYVYYGYKFVRVNDKIILEKSAPVKNLFEIKDEYPCFKKDSIYFLNYSEPYRMDKILTKDK